MLRQTKAAQKKKKKMTKTRTGSGRRSAADLDQNPRCFSGLSERATHSALFLYYPSFHFFTL
jgi:hypothetical protein